MYLLRLQRTHIISVVLLLAPLVGAQLALAHCDTLDGPVIADARQALAQGDVSPVLKWTMPAHEQEVRDSFLRTLAVRELGAGARELADTYFFETLVRLHRAGEGAPYDGLKPSGAELTPAVVGADEALENGSIDSVEAMLLGIIREGIDERFARAFEARQHAGESVEAGREYVEAYVEFVHYIENLEALSSAHEEHGSSGTKAPPPTPGAHGH